MNSLNKTQRTKYAVIVVLLYSNIGNAAPQWASVNNGTFLCFSCSGIHRGFGVTISFVRSLTMDVWNEKQIAFMQNGGNGKFKEFMALYGLENEKADNKYKTNAADYYRRQVIFFSKP